jgi:hypothetical protein
MTTGNVSPTHYIRSSSFAVITRYDVREIIGTKTVEFNDNGGSGEAAFEDGTWSVRIESKPVESAPDALDVFLHFKLESGASAQTSLGFQMDVFNWSRDHYVLMPATAYNGNRFIIQKQDIPPMYREEDARLDMPVIITTWRISMLKTARRACSSRAMICRRRRWVSSIRVLEAGFSC